MSASRIFKYVKYMLIAIIGLVVALVAAVIIFVNTQPQFGQRPQGEDLERISKSPHYEKDGFVNLIETTQADFWVAIKTLPDFLFGKNGSPREPLPVKYDEAESQVVDSLCYVTWYGHSAFFIEMDGKRILIDPMLGDVAAPTSFGSHRYANQDTIPISDLKDIDAMIISHDHYDHLDHESILKLKDEVTHFYTPLGVGSHLKHWGVPADRITELDWWQSASLDNIEIVACPSRHFSGRGLTDANSTQWASWVLKSANSNIYFSGDGGYGPHFQEIGERFGPFDFAMMECGQYNKAWSNIHMMPEESVQAGLDVKSKVQMPIHWGAFRLSVHTWTDPIIRYTNEAERLGAEIIHPYIGERFIVGQDFPRATWWLDQ